MKFLIRGFSWAAVTLLASSLILAQENRPERQPGQPGGPRGGFGQRGGPGGPGGMVGAMGGSRLFLLRVPAVQKELELLDDQIAEIEKLMAEMRPERGPGGRGPGGPGGSGRGPGDRGRGERRPGSDSARPQSAETNQPDEARVPADGTVFVQAQAPRRGPEITPEQMAEFARQARERSAKEKEKLAEILLPHQMKRLEEIYIQTMGVRALQDPEVAEKLKITAEQQDQMRQAQQTVFEGMRELFTPGADREQMREKMQGLRKQAEEKALAVLSADQQKQFTELKGMPFQMPEDAFGFGFGGRGPGGPGGPGRPGGPGAPGGRGPEGGERPRQPATETP